MGPGLEGWEGGVGVQLESAKRCPPGGIAILSLGQFLGSGRPRCFCSLFSRESHPAVSDPECSAFPLLYPP